MPQTLSFNLVHIIFSTKDRKALITDERAAALHAYLAGGVADHIDLAVRLAPTKSAAKVMSEIKTSSSWWMKDQGVKAFAWQGYGLFSVSPADVGALLGHIGAQREHHRRRSFQEEMRAFYEKYHVAFDERYVWV